MSRKKLTPQQLHAARIIAENLDGSKTKQDIADEVGVARMTIYNWEQNPAFADEINRLTKAASSHALPRVMAKVPEMIVEGENAAMLRTFLQYLGVLTDKVDVDTGAKGGVDLDDVKAKLAAMGLGEGNDDDDSDVKDEE